MHSNRIRQIRILCLMLLVFSGALPGFAGVSRSIQEQYKKEYENKAMFLKVPVYGEKQSVHISGQTVRVDQGTGVPRFKVGDQVRILLVEFAGDEIRFRMSGIGTPGIFEFGYRFDSNLLEDFPNRDVFERAIQSTLTEGLKYTEIEEAKRSFVENQFEQSVRDIAGSASISREAVLKSIAPQVPAYRDAQREIDNLRGRLQDVSGQLAQAQAENRKLESESKAQQAELSRLKSSNAALQSKIDDSASQISKLGDDLRDAKGSQQGYQRELANLQRSLNIKVDTGRDLAAQIADLGQAMRKLQKENDTLGNQINSLHTNLDSQQAANARLLGNNEELKASNGKLQATINTLTSKEDSLGRQYVDLKREKEKLEEFASAVAALRTRIEEEKTEDGMHTGRASLYLKSVLLGSLTWNIPEHLNHNESKSAEAAFSAESIDAIRMSPEERHLRGMLGDKLKVRVDLASGSNAVEVAPEADEGYHDVGERDHFSWRWNITNRSSQDASLSITARLRNKNSSEIPLFQHEKTVLSSNAVRQIRGYLHPIPLAIGILLGFLLFGVVGIFRRPKKPGARSHGPADPPAAVIHKKL
jgi:predicted nuclease with TOPRIM domain